MSDGRETLEGTAEDQEGGLVLTVPTKEKHVFKAPAPRTSLLGEPLQLAWMPSSLLPAAL